MRRLLLLVATVASASLLFVPGAVAAEPETEETQNDESKSDETESKVEADREDTGERREKRERPAKPRIGCEGSFSFGSTPKITCEWSSAHPDAANFRVVRRGGGERRVFQGEDLDDNELVDTDVKYGTRYRYRVVVLDEDGTRLQRSHWTKARKLRGRVERLPLACEVYHAEESTEPGKGGDGDDLAQEPVEGSGTAGEEEGSPNEQLDGLAAVCEWDAPSRNDAVYFELWRKAKGERKQLVSHFELDQLRHIDELPAGTTKVKYVVRAVNEDGRRVGHSKIRWVHFGSDTPSSEDER